MGITQYVQDIKSKKITALKACEAFVKRCQADKKGAILEVFDSWKTQAKKIDDKIKKGESVGRLAGVPITIKDNLLYKGHKASAASKIMQGFVSPYTATVIEKLLAEDAIIIARVDMDEFAMGGLGRYAYQGVAKNAHSDNHHAGGSSSGSAVSVALDYCLASLGSDTGGSVRFPAALNGVVGVKPTYGSVSRYGAVAFGSGIEQIGVFAKTTADTQLVLDVISGKCEKDATTLVPPTKGKTFNGLNGLKVGRVIELMDAFKGSPFYAHYDQIFEKLKSQGAKVIDISLPTITKSINCYYALAPTQGASNLARFDGVKYGAHADAETLDELYVKTRSQGFGAEVKRRIVLGNMLLGTKVQNRSNVKNKITTELESALEKVDVIITPTGAGSAPQIGKPIDPVEDYLVDLFTAPANLTGLPAMSIPCGTDELGLPLGLQIIAARWEEKFMFAVGGALDEI